MTSTMDRRDLFKTLAGSGLMAGLASLGEAKEVAEAKEKVRRGSAPVRITDVRTILTQPGDWLVIVKIETSKPGLYGVGCATHGERPLAVRAVVDEYLKPLLVGKSVEDIEDIWQTQYVTSYFRSGVTLNNALSGVDRALWDILGKRAGVPLYQAPRRQVPQRRHALPPRHRHGPAGIGGTGRPQATWPRATGTSASSRPSPACTGYGGTKAPTGDQAADTCRRRASPRYLAERRLGAEALRRPCPKLFEHLRSEKLATRSSCCTTSTSACRRSWPSQLAKDLEPIDLFFLEDPFAPEDVGYFEHLRAQTARRSPWASCSTTQRVAAAGRRPADRLHPHPHLAGRRADDGPQDRRAVRVLRRPHRLARARATSRRSATPPTCTSTWPCHNFGIQEGREFTQAEHEVFPGCPELKDGYYLRQRQARPGDRPRREAGGEVPDTRRPAATVAPTGCSTAPLCDRKQPEDGRRRTDDSVDGWPRQGRGSWFVVCS